MSTVNRSETIVTTDRAYWSRSGRLSLDLDDLRAFLELCDGMPGTTPVTYKRELFPEGGSHTETLEAIDRVTSTQVTR